MAQSHRSIDTMSIEIPRETGLRIQEVVLLIDIQRLVIVTTGIIVELIVDTICFVSNVTILDISKHIPLLTDMIGCLQEDVAIKLMGV